MGQASGRSRGSATRSRLLAAALDVVADVGYPRATTKAIAAAAGVAEGTIYRHFPDKHALFLAAVIDANEPVNAWMTGLPERAGHGALADNLAETMTRLSGLREHMLPLELAILTDPELAERRRTGMAALGIDSPDMAAPGLPDPNPPTLLARYLAAEQHLGRVRADVDPIQAAITILATLMGLTVLPEGDAPPSATGQPIAPALLDTASDILARGLQ